MDRRRVTASPSASRRTHTARTSQEAGLRALRETETMTTMSRTITVAIDTACRHAGVALIWGVAEGDDTEAAVADAATYLAEGEAVRTSHRREAEALDIVTIQWPAGKALPDGQDPTAIRLAQEALA